LGVEILQAKLSFTLDLLRIACRALTGHTAKPTNRCIVIMCAGVDDNVLMIVVRQIEILCIATKSKLQDAHPRETKTISQCFNVRRNHAQVLRNYRHLAKRFSDGSKQFSAGRRNPTPPFRSLIAARYLPARGETAEVIDACDIVGLERCADAINPPFETIRRHLLPVVKRIAPELARGAEVIRRYSRHDNRSSIFIQLKL